MEIGIIGSGASGLHTAWLLEEHHNVTVLEKDDRFGGHAQTVDVELNGKTYHVDTGIHFFSHKMQPSFVNLLDHIGATYVMYPPSTTFHDERKNWTVCMPPFGSMSRAAGLLHPATVGTLINFRKLILGSIDLVENEGDFQITLEDFVAGLGLPERFQTDFVYPYLCSFYGISHELVRTYSARNILSYLVLLRPPVVSPLPLCEMTGGMQAYIDRFITCLKKTALHANAGAEQITHAGERYRVQTAAGEFEFDHLVIATSAEQASALCAPLEGSAPVRKALDTFEYQDTTIAVHGDVRRMPPKRSQWSVVNGLFDGTYCSTTDWSHGNQAVDLFRSWVTHVDMPDPVYATVEYRHPHPNQNYFRAQEMLRPLQGTDNLWFTGMYVDHYDNHEGAIRSAMNVARQLAPDNDRLKILEG